MPKIYIFEENSHLLIDWFSISTFHINNRKFRHSNFQWESKRNLSGIIKFISTTSNEFKVAISKWKFLISDEPAEDSSLKYSKIQQLLGNIIGFISWNQTNWKFSCEFQNNAVLPCLRGSKTGVHCLPFWPIAVSAENPSGTLLCISWPILLRPSMICSGKPSSYSNCIGINWWWMRGAWTASQTDSLKCKYRNKTWKRNAYIKITIFYF